MYYVHIFKLLFEKGRVMRSKKRVFTFFLTTFAMWDVLIFYQQHSFAGIKADTIRKLCCDHRALKKLQIKVIV